MSQYQPKPFRDLLETIVMGGRVTKAEWADPEYWVQVLSGQLVIRKPDGVYYPWIISLSDLTSADWLEMEYA